MISIPSEHSCMMSNGGSSGGSSWDLPRFIPSSQSQTGVCAFKRLVMGLSASVSLSRLPWLSHPPIKSDMDDSLSFVGLQDPEVRPSDGSNVLNFHICGVSGQTHWGDSHHVEWEEINWQEVCWLFLY